MMEKKKCNIGDVVQIDPTHDKTFGGCFMIVTEPQTWGAKGYIPVPGGAGLSNYGCEWEHMKFIGLALWKNKG